MNRLDIVLGLYGITAVVFILAFIGAGPKTTSKYAAAVIMCGLLWPIALVISFTLAVKEAIGEGVRERSRKIRVNTPDE